MVIHDTMNLAEHQHSIVIFLAIPIKCDALPNAARIFALAICVAGNFVSMYGDVNI